ncbi:hypothetical protein HYV83_04730 [Candidatus Woesearchaeota archaeon]|nr:hypothetical protein [Candidatus Woesearchaeota archaeon]
MEQNIQTVIVKLKKARVANFSTAENTVSIAVAINDGKDKEHNWKARITEPRLMAAKLLTELIALEESEHAEFDGEVMANSSTVLLHESARTETALVDFFQTIYSKARKLKNATKSDGYLNMVADLRRTEMIF